MPRQKEVADIPTAQRTFIKTSEWENGESRSYYYTGYEKTERTSKAGNPYTQYLFYLIPIMPDGGIGVEETLGIFPTQAAAFKNAGISDYQEIKITRVLTPGKGNYENEDYEVLAFKNELPVAERPIEMDYPEMKAAPAKSDYAMSPPTASQEEISLDDIPF